MGQWKKVITSGSVALLNTVTASGGFSGSNLNPLLAFNGNRVISNNALPTGVYNVNYETTGDISDFIEAVFFKNATPTIVLNQNFTLQQFTTGSIGGTFVGDIQGADEDASQTPQFILGNFNNVLSNSDDNYFSITNSNGVGSIFLNNGITADTTFNIDSEGPQGDAYPLPIIIKDDFGAQSETVVYIQVTPNNAPIIQGYNGSSFTEITGDTFTAGAVLNENNPSGIIENDHFILKFSDINNDNLSVSTLNLGDATDDNFFNFSINHSAGTIKLNQITSSLDFDAVENRNFSYKITVHDEHHPTQPGVGDDSNALKEITFNWSVGNNPPPTISDNTFTIVENAADGTSVGTIYPSDTAGDGTSVFLFTGFTLISVQLDGDGTNLMNTGILSTVSPNAFVPSQDPFEITTVGSGKGEIKKKSGAILNSDVANKYVYTATVTDIYNEGFNQSTATITINITDASVPSVSNNGSAHIIESGISNNFIAINTNGVTGTTFTYSTSPTTQMNWEVTTVPAGILKVNCGQNTSGGSNSGTGSNVRFRLDGNLSGSSTQINNNVTFDGNNTVEVTLVGSQTSFNSTQVTKNFTLNIAENHEPTLSVIADTATETNNRINYLAVEGAQLDSVLVTPDSQEGDAINFDSILLTGDTNELTSSFNSSTNKIFINAKTNLSSFTGQTFSYTASIKDIHGFRFSNEIKADIPIVGRETPSITAGSSGTIIESDNGTSTDVGITITDNFNTFPGTVFIESFTIKANQDAFDEIFEIVPSTGTTFNSSIHTFKVRTKASLSGSIHNINHTTFPTRTLNTSITDNFKNTFDGPNITINVTENHPPTLSAIANTTAEGNNRINYLAIEGAQLDSVLVTADTQEGDAINFDSIFLTGDTNKLTSSFNSSNNKIFINAKTDLTDLAGTTLNYGVKIKDIHGFSYSNLIEASIPIVDRSTPTINGDLTGTIIESDSGTSTAVGITINDNFNTFAGDVHITNFIIKDNQDNFEDIFTIVPTTSYGPSNHSFNVQTKASLSGSTIHNGNFSTQTLNTQVTDNYNNTFNGPVITINVTANSAPTIGSLSENEVKNTNEATSGVILGTHTLADADSIPTNMHSNMPGTVSFTGTSGLTVANTSNQLQIKAASNLSAGTYTYTATVRDIHGFRTSTVSDSITITQAGTGTFSGGTQFFIVDTAADNDQIHTATGYTNGNDNGSQGDINVTYNSDEGNPSLASFASNNNQINISSTGKLTIGTTISGSGSPNAGDDITSTITATDNYGNQGTQAITVTVFANDPPSNTSYNTATYSSNAVAPVSVDTILAHVTFDDDEHDYPYSASISGTDKDKLYLATLNANSSSCYLKTSTIINPNTSNPGTPQTLSFNLVVHDKHNLNSSTARTLTIADAPPQVFIYTMQDDASTWAANYSNASLNLGLRTSNHSIVSNGILSKFISNGQIGSSSFSADNGFSDTTVATRIQGGTLTDLKSTSTTTGLRSLGVITNDSGPRRSIIVFPSSSLLANKPYSGSNNATGDTNDGIVNSKQNTSNGQYRFYLRETNNNESDQSMFIKYITLDNPSLGYSDWGVIYHNAFNELTHYWYMVDDNDPKLGV